MTASRPPFVLLSLPRSRSRWLSVWLSEGAPAPCGHDLLVFCARFEDFLGCLQSGKFIGSAETAGMLGWKLLRLGLPSCRIGVIRRPLMEVTLSLRRKNFFPDDRELFARNQVLDVVAQAPGVKVWNFHELSNPAVGRDIWEFCRGPGWNEDRFEELCHTNIQIDLDARKRYLLEHGFEIEYLKQTTAAQMARVGGPACLGLN